MIERRVLSIHPGPAGERVTAEKPVAVQPQGLVGDEAPSVRAEAGWARAIYAYPSEHYAFWQTVRAQAKVAAWGDVLAPGSLGEQLTLAGLVESNAWIGDVLRFPECDLAVSEPHFPDASLNATLGFEHAAKLMDRSGWCGFYLAVRRPGRLTAGDRFELIAGPRDISIAELLRDRGDAS